MKNVLKKSLALSLCALISTPFSAVFAVKPRRTEFNTQNIMMDSDRIVCGIRNKKG